MRKVENEAEARAMLARVARSGREIGAWARERGVDGRSLRAWSINLARAARRRALVKGAPPVARLVELVPTPVEVTPRRARYALRLGDVALEFGDDFNEGTLRRVLEALRAC